VAMAEDGQPAYGWRPIADSMHGREIVTAYLRGTLKHGLFNKLIHRPAWEAAISSIGLPHGQDEMLVYAEDLLCGGYLYRNARSYAALHEAQYIYNWRRESTMNTRDIARIRQSIQSLVRVMAALEPLLKEIGTPADVAAFLQRELGWALDHLVSQVNEPLGADTEGVVRSLRTRYLTQPTG
jgi:hypothetical protein